MRSPTWLVVAAMLAACDKPAKPRGEVAAAGLPPAPASATKPPADPASDASARKARSEARLRAEGVQMLASLPVIDAEGVAKMRSRDEVLDRSIAILATALHSERLERAMLDKLVTDFAAGPMLSPEEKAFMATTGASDKERAQFTWRYECLEVLLWALRFEEKLGRPTELVDAARLVRVMTKELGPKPLRERAKLRPAKEILDEADLIYRYDWACVNERLTGTPAGGGIDCEIVVERHRALNWLRGYMGQAWDDVSTDT